MKRTSLKLTCLLVHLKLAYGDSCMSRVLMFAYTADSLIAPYSWQWNSWTCLHHDHHGSFYLSCPTTRHVLPRMPAIRTNQLLRYRYSTVHCSFKPHTETYPQTNACNYNRTTHYVVLMEQATHDTPRTQVTTHSVELARIPPVSTSLESSIYQYNVVGVFCRIFAHNKQKSTAKLDGS